MTANSFMFRGNCPTEVHDEIMCSKIDKSALDIPTKCIKHAANHIYETLRMVSINLYYKEYFRKSLKFQKWRGGETI